MTLSQKFKIHPVGQGFFYSGQIKVNDQEFNFVVDCGSRSNIEDVVSNFWTDLNKTDEIDTIDLLVITHFDSDHVNGISKLVEGKKVIKIIAPFINYCQWLSLFLLKKNERENFISFLISNLSKITFIDSSEPDILFNLPEENDIVFGLDINNIEFTFEINDAVKDEGNNIIKSIDVNVGKIKANAFELMYLQFYRRKISSNDQKFFDTVWELFKNEKSLNEDDPNFIENLLETIKVIDTNCLKKILENTKKTLGNDGIEVKLTDINNRSALCAFIFNSKKLYKLISANSVVTITAPKVENFDQGVENYLINEIRKLSYSNKMKDFDNIFQNIRFSNTMLTSDSVLKEEEDINIFFEKFKNLRYKFWLFQVPHHGSIKNSSKKLYSKLCNCYLFCNHGENYKAYPNECIKKIISQENPSKKMFSVNENIGSQFEYCLEYNRIRN